MTFLPFPEAWDWERLPQEWRRGPCRVLGGPLVLKWGLNSPGCKIQCKLVFLGEEHLGSAGDVGSREVSPDHPTASPTGLAWSSPGFLGFVWFGALMTRSAPPYLGLERLPVQGLNSKQSLLTVNTSGVGAWGPPSARACLLQVTSR